MKRTRCMPRATFLAAVIARLLPAIAWIFFALSGCLSDPDDSSSRGTVTFTVLRFDSPVAADSAAVDLGFYVGPNGCWTADDLFVERSGQTITITGTAHESDEKDGGCPEDDAYAESALALPALDPGTYFLRACSLRETLVVAEAPDSSARRVVMRGALISRDGACGLFQAEPSMAGVSSLPDSLPSGDLLVWGEELASIPCENPGGDFFVAVRRVAPAPT